MAKSDPVKQDRIKARISVSLSMGIEPGDMYRVVSTASQPKGFGYVVELEYVPPPPTDQVVGPGADDGPEEPPMAPRLGARRHQP